MRPELFIKKHITDALLREGFSELVAQGGLLPGLITIAACRRQAARGRLLMTVISMPASGRWGRQQK